MANVATADIVVIGGGVMGTSIAFQLAQRRAGRVTVLEKRFLGAGSSGKSGAIIRQHYSHRLTTTLARRSLKFFEEFPDRVGGPPVFTRSGMAIVVPGRDRAALEANVAMQREIGVDVRLISADALRAIDPAAHVAGDEAVAYEAEAGYVEAMQVVGSFVEAARQMGASVQEGVEVKRILIEGSRVAGVETDQGVVQSRTVVIAAGPWAARVAKSAGIALPVNPCRTQVALFRRPPDFTGHLSVYGDFTNVTYCKPTWGELVHVGSLSSQEAAAIVDPDRYREAPDEEFLHETRERLARRLPVMRRAPGRGGYAALYAITPDWHPILDRLAGIAGLYCAAGFSGHGFKMSPIVGQLMSELIVDGAATSVNIAALRFSRFEQDDLIRSPYEYGVMG